MVTGDLCIHPHHLLGPTPIITFNDHLPSHIIGGAIQTSDSHYNMLVQGISFCLNITVQF